MPLNINNGQEGDAQKPQPILRGAVEEPKSNRKMLMVLFGLVVVGAAVFLVYLFSTLKPRAGAIKVPAESALSDTASRVVEHTPAALPPPTGTGDGSAAQGAYTIYVASYGMRSPAEEEVGRWKEAGYQAFVVEAHGHYRVSVGAYASLSEARSGAKELNEGFENGYWIDRR